MRAASLEWAPYYRPNFFANTPDILHEYLQHGGRAGLRGAARPRGDALAELRDLLRLRALRERAGARGQRGVPGLGEVRGQGAQARRAAAAAGATPERDQARESGAAARSTTSTFLETENDHLLGYAKQRRRERGRRRREPRPARGRRRASRVVPAALGFPPAFPVRRPALPATATRGTPAATTSGSSPGAESHVLRVS